MCTALKLTNKKDFLFGRNMDIEYDLHQSVIITPRNYVWKMRSSFDNKNIKNREMKGYAMIGTGLLDPVNEYPLYFDGMNEKGLAMAELNFPQKAVYSKQSDDSKINVTPYELLPWILSQFATVAELKQKLNLLNIVDIDYSSTMKTAPLHFIIWDENESIVIESTNTGIHIYDNPTGVLTNNPEFDWHLHNLVQYRNILTKQDNDVVWSNLNLKPFAAGMNAFGLPGDFSSTSRFVKTVFLQSNSFIEQDEISLVTQYFHILDSVAMVKGSVVVNNNLLDITLYSCCMNTTTKKYYWKSYSNNQINCINFMNEDLNSSKIKTFDFLVKQKINEIN